MPKSLTMFALLTSLTGLYIAPSPAFAQVCNPALAAGFLYQCPPGTDGFYFDHRGVLHFCGDDGFHDNHGFHCDGAENNFDRGDGHGGAWGTVKAQGVAVRVKVGVQYIRVNRNSRPQTCVQPLAFCEMQVRREKARKHCLP